MTSTQYYGWPKLERGTANYPQAHSALVDAIDGELHRVEQQAGGTAALPNRVVATTDDDLRRAFATLTDGTHVHIVREDGAPPLEIADYLDIDAADVLVTGAGARPQITVPDGANTGGFRVGYNNHAENVTIRGVSYDGNGRNQTMQSGGFGIKTLDAFDVTITGCDIRETAPHHAHNKNNSGVSISGQTAVYTIFNNHFQDIGDRAIETGGSYGWVVANTSKNGFDRMVAFDAAGATAVPGFADYLVIAGNQLDYNESGSVIGGRGEVSGPENGTIIIAHNIATGRHRTLVRLTSGGNAANIKIIGNMGIAPANPNRGIEIEQPGVTVENNHLRGYAEGVVAIAEETTITDNRIEGSEGEGIWIAPDSASNGASPGGGRSVAQGNTLIDNAADGSTRAEVRCDVNGARVVNNNILSLRNGVAAFDNPAGESLFAWNVLPAGATTFDRVQSGTVQQANLNVPQN